MHRYITMVLIGGLLSVRVSPTFLGDDMDEDRTGRFGVLDLIENRDQVIYVVAIDRTNVVKPQLLKQGRAGTTDHTASVLVDFGSQFVHWSTDLLGDPLKHPIGNDCFYSSMKQDENMGLCLVGLFDFGKPNITFKRAEKKRAKDKCVVGHHSQEDRIKQMWKLFLVLQNRQTIIES